MDLSGVYKWTISRAEPRLLLQGGSERSRSQKSLGMDGTERIRIALMHALTVGLALQRATLTVAASWCSDYHCDDSYLYVVDI